VVSFGPKLLALVEFMWSSYFRAIAAIQSDIEALLLIIHLRDHMLDDGWSDAFVGEGKMNRPIAAVEFEDWSHNGAHLLALHVGSVTGNTQSQESDKDRDHCVISAGAARLPVFRHGADFIADRIMSITPGDRSNSWRCTGTTPWHINGKLD
jgi:hypothetical protein